MIRIDCTQISQELPGSDLTDSGPVRQAHDCLVKNGYAILDNVLPTALVATLKRAFEARYAAYFSDEPSEEKLTVGDRREILGPGDAYHFSSRIPHRFRNPGDEECELISACTPPYL